MRQNKKWKRLETAGLAVCLLLASPAAAYAGSPEFARTAEEWARLRDNVLEYEEIEDLIHEYNTTVLNNEQEYKKDIAKSAEDIVDDILDEADYYRSLASDADSTVEELSYEAQARSAENTAENNVDDGQSKYLTYELAEKQIVMQAQSSMNNWYQLQNTLRSTKKSREILEASLASAQSRMSLGMATYSDVLNASQQLTDLDATIIALESQIETARKSLILMMGWSQDANPEIRALPEPDLTRIDQIDTAADTAKALENDYTLKIDTRKLDNATNDTVRAIYVEAINNDKRQIPAAVDQAYRSLLLARDSYNQAELAYQIAQKNYTAAQTKYSLGTIGRTEFLSYENSLVSAETARDNAKLSILSAQESYDWVVRGVR